MSYGTLLPIFAAEVLHGSSRLFGLLQGCHGLGAFLGAALLLRLPGRGRLPRRIGFGATLLGGGLQLAAQVPSLRATGYRFHLRLGREVLEEPGVRRIAKLMAAALVGLHLLNHPEVATTHREAGPDLLAFGDAVFEWLLGKGLPMDSDGLVGLVKEAARLGELAAERMAPFVLADDLEGNSTAPTAQPTLP